MKNAPVVVRAITWLPVGGIERRLVSVVPRLRDRGWDARVVCLREEGPLAGVLRDRGVDVQVIPFRSRLSPSALLKFRGYLKKNNVAILHSHMYRANIPATLSGLAARTPVIFAQVHNVDSWDSARQAATDRALAGHRAGTICVSRAVQKDVMEKLRLTEKQTPVLYNGIDTQQFRPDESLRKAFRAEIGAAENQIVIVVPARLHPQKNPAGMLEAFRRSLQPATDPKPILVFAGDGKLQDELKKDSGDVVASVRFLGRRDDMPAILNGADLVFLSSFKEGFSNAIVEALACGKPVIASDVGGNAEAITDRSHGWIHPAGDTDAAVAQLGVAYGLGVDGLRAMSDACVRQAARFSLDALIDATHRLYVEHLGYEP